jgi:rhodanese-related sulfurtransferase
MRHLTTDGLAGFLRHHPGAKVLDVRFAHEREAGHLPGDHHVPWYTPVWEPDPDFLQRARQCLAADDHVLVICQRGSRSLEAALLLESSGFRHVYNMLGGYADIQCDWRAEFEAPSSHASRHTGEPDHETD